MAALTAVTWRGATQYLVVELQRRAGQGHGGWGQVLI